MKNEDWASLEKTTKMMTAFQGLRVYAIVFAKYTGETLLFIAKDSEEATRKAMEWTKKNHYGKDIASLNLEGTIDA